MPGTPLRDIKTEHVPEQHEETDAPCNIETDELG